MKRAIVSSLLSVVIVLAGVVACNKAGTAARNAANSEEKAEKELAVGDLTVEEVLKARCPHGPTIECAECRYEVGVVKVDPSLVRKDDGSGTGLVKVVRAAKSRMPSSIALTGVIRMNENAAVHVSPRVPGVVREVNVDIGAEVRKDDILFTIASAELAQALSDHERNMALAELSGKAFQREKSLYEKKVASENDMIEAQMRYEEHLTARKASGKRLRILGLSEDEVAAVAPSDRDGSGGSLHVRAPIAGTVIEKHAVIGELVEPGKDTMVVADLDTVWMWGNLYERDLGRILDQAQPAGLPAEIAVPAFPGTVFRGTMNLVGAIVDETTRTLPVRVVIANKDRRLRPGMFCHGRIVVGSPEEVLAVPKDAILSDEGRDFVFTHMNGDYFLRVNVTRGRTFTEGIEVLKGVSAGQTIVTEGAFVLKSDVLRSKMGAGCAD